MNISITIIKTPRKITRMKLWEKKGLEYEKNFYLPTGHP